MPEFREPNADGSTWKFAIHLAKRVFSFPDLNAIVLTGFSLFAGCSLFTGCARAPQQKEAAFLQSGRKHFQARDFSRAIIDFRNAAQIMPQDAEPHYQLGLTYETSGYAQSGVNELVKATDLDPKHLAAQLKLAEILTANQNLDVVREGKKRAEQALDLSPNNADALQMLATAELRLGDPESAVQHLQQALREVPQHLSASMTLALVKLREKDLEGAEQVMRTAAAEAPRSPEPAVALGRFLILIRKPQDAEKEFRRALRIDPKHGPALTALATLVLRTGRSGEAEELFQRAAALPGNDYRPLHALFLLETGKSDAAVAELDRIYRADRTDRAARTRLVAANVRTSRIADAEKVLAEALRRNAKDVDALLQRGELYLEEGRLQEAQDDLNGVLRFKPDSPQAHRAMARIHQSRHATASQIQELSEAVRLDPKFLAARIELAHAFTLSNSPQAAIDVLDHAPLEDRQNLAVIVERNAALYALGDDAALRKGVDRGFAIARTPELLLQDGLLRVKRRDFKGGRGSLEEALGQQPQDWRALEALAASYAVENKVAEATAVVRHYTSRVSNAAARQFLGDWLSRTGERAGARAAFEAARSLSPDPTAADFALAELDLREGKLDSARNTLLTLLRKQPRNLAFILDLAQAEFRAGRMTEAIGYYEQGVQADPKNVPALNNLAYLLADTGRDPDRALMLAQQVKELAPRDATVDDTIGWAYYKKGLYQRAIEYFGQSKSATPRWKCHLAMAYAKVGDRRQATELLQAALKADPSVPEASRVMDLLAASKN